MMRHRPPSQLYERFSPRARADPDHVKTWRSRWQQEGCGSLAIRSFHPVKPLGVARRDLR
jgi:hypothetical protein